MNASALFATADDSLDCCALSTIGIPKAGAQLARLLTNTQFRTWLTCCSSRPMYVKLGHIEWSKTALHDSTLKQRRVVREHLYRSQMARYIVLIKTKGECWSYRVQVLLLSKQSQAN